MSSISILPFGDSLTSGFHNRGMSSHPYSMILNIKLQESFPKMSFDCEHKGVPGERATNMSKRLKLLLKKKSYDYIIILAGTNDMAFTDDPQEIINSLEELYQIVQKQKKKKFFKKNVQTQLIVVTIPERSADQNYEKKKNQKKEINNWIRGYQQKNQSFCHLYDLFQEVPYSGIDEDLQKKIWDDGLHFKPYGYDLFGKGLAKLFTQILEGTNQNNVKKKKKKKK
ncbi:hypothetical protein M0812_18393 [Anaeramoeba flamelloides]|uniref:SGNH hydrolase-type esterase domain-containing protein n=1 Tax=Anaeramoeba flamelloides TaxID=1746091 RepID=A0AAV7Z2I6_9EUKA|nr:hypothetical protein M0812_18393 [Anaeramoeba flamelloides]